MRHKGVKNTNFSSPREFFQAHNAPNPVFGRGSVLDPAGGGLRYSSRPPSRLEREGKPPTHSPPLGVSISAPTAPHVTPVVDPSFVNSGYAYGLGI